MENTKRDALDGLLVWLVPADCSAIGKQSLRDRYEDEIPVERKS